MIYVPFVAPTKPHRKDNNYIGKRSLHVKIDPYYAMWEDMVGNNYMESTSVCEANPATCSHCGCMVYRTIERWRTPDGKMYGKTLPLPCKCPFCGCEMLNAKFQSK